MLFSNVTLTSTSSLKLPVYSHKRARSNCLKEKGKKIAKVAEESLRSSNFDRKEKNRKRTFSSHELRIQPSRNCKVSNSKKNLSSKVIKNRSVSPVFKKTNRISSCQEALKIENPMQYTFGKKSLAIAFLMDWNSDDSLFDLDFTKKWIMNVKNKKVMKNLKCTDIERNQLFKINMPGSSSLTYNHQAFIDFLTTLISKEKLFQDKYGTQLINENKEKIRKMMCGIMNLLKEKQGKNNLVNASRYTMVIHETDLALTNCLNAINTAIENLFYQIHALSQEKIDLAKSADRKNLETVLGQKVTYRLQMLRDAIFRESIQYILDNQPENQYRTHAAATFNYYYGQKAMCEKLGLPLSVSQLDQNYQSYALKDQERKIHEEFNNRYTPLKIIEVIYDAITNPEDQSIKTALFTDWLHQESQLNPDEFLLEEEDEKSNSIYSYNPMTVIQLLKKLQLINS